jgi:hypothetical protein
VSLDANKFYLIRTLSVVGFDGDGKGYFHRLSPGAMLTITGGSSRPGFIEIMHDGELCHTFEQDFVDRSKSSRRAFAAITA